jgi:hypothetical protein
MEQETGYKGLGTKGLRDSGLLCSNGLYQRAEKPADIVAEGLG